MARMNEISSFLLAWPFFGRGGGEGGAGDDPEIKSLN